MTRTSALELPPDVERATREGDRVVITRDGVTLAAIVPIADLRRLERLEAEEDAADLNAGERALAEWNAQGRPTASLEDIKRDLGL